MKESYKKIVNEDLRGDARKITCRVLLVTGETDTVTPRREAEAYLACFKWGGLKMMQGGHFAFAEYPLAFNLIAEEFLINGRIV
jgi:pimeloyl-ACP methyl ester carboxylesterase